jgi:nitric oxide synthase oxygenase domain/subunit
MSTVNLIDVLPANKNMSFKTSEYLYEQLKKCSEDTGLSMSYLIELCLNKSLLRISKEIFHAYDQANKNNKGEETAKATS